MWNLKQNHRGVAGVAMVAVSLGLLFGMNMACAEADEWETVADVDEAFQVGYFQVTGISESGQSRYAAVRAATVLAQRDLLERFQGVRIQGETTISDGMLQSDVIRTKIKGFLRGAANCGQKYDKFEKFATVCLRLNLNGKGGIYESIYPTMRKENVIYGLDEQPTESAPTPPPPSTTISVADLIANNDGVIIELSGLVFKPAIVNRILNEKGDILFDPSKVINSILVERGTGGFTSQLGKAKGLLASWGSTNPIIIKAVETRKGTDVVISSADATKIFASDQKTSFLSQAKVVFVIN